MSIERKLASIRKVSDIQEIEGCSRIAVAQIDGWQVIVKKDEFQSGDLCVFYEIDSFLPDDPMYAFLPKKTEYKGKAGYRLKTIKLRGTISQGLALPPSQVGISNPTLHQDVTEQLGVIKYDVAEVQSFQSSNNTQKSAGSFPPFIPKTDQSRIQNLPTYFQTMIDEEFEETLKLDGSSMTCYSIPVQPTLWQRFKSIFGTPYKNYHFGVCSRNQELKPDTTSNFWKAAIKYNIEQNLPCGYAIQGELVAPNIQSNHEKVHDVEFYIFDIYNIREGRYLTPSERAHMMTGSLQSVPHVPIISTSKIFDNHDLQSLLAHAEGPSMNPDTISEGRVYKHVSRPISFKIISNQYLLREK